MKAVHFGAGNIGRGFVGLSLHKAGYEVVFADVNADLIDALSASSSYRVREVGDGAQTWTVDNCRAINSDTNLEELVAEIATADVVTTAVGPNILRFVAPAIAQGIAARDVARPPLTVMACENAIGATSTLREHIEQAMTDAAALDRAVFANTAVDRIVPGQPEGAGLDVTVEAFFEWAIESGPFGNDVPSIPDAHFVKDLSPYIERKLFTVNTGHATAAYYGFLAGVTTMADAFTTPSVAFEVRAVLDETKALLVAKHEFHPKAQQDYIERNMVRFANPELSDTVERVGRQPLRKLSRHERFIGPAAQLAERGIEPVALLRAIGAALRFDAPDDDQSAELVELLSTLEPGDLVARITGLEPQHPLFDRVADVVAAVQRSPTTTIGGRRPMS